MNRWLLLQLADSAFPVGGFAHSAGLEAAFQLGEVNSGPELRQFLTDALFQVGYGALPFVRAAHEASNDIAAIDAECDAFLSNHVANRASRTQGRAFISTAARVFAAPPVSALHNALRTRSFAGHYAPMFGSTLAALGLERLAAQEIYLHLALRGITSAAVRLGLLGPHEAQRIQHQSAPLLDRVLHQCEGLALDEVSQPAPLLDLVGSMQDRLYSRLFQS